jgi:hypothetical protein
MLLATRTGQQRRYMQDLGLRRLIVQQQAVHSGSGVTCSLDVVGPTRWQLCNS